MDPFTMLKEGTVDACNAELIVTLSLSLGSVTRLTMCSLVQLKSEERTEGVYSLFVLKQTLLSQG